MSRIILFNKPYGVLSQFTGEDGHPGLRDYLSLPGYRAAGRLDADSEGLLILTDDGALQHRLAHPRFGKEKTYLAQVEGVPSAAALESLRQGVDLGDFVTRPAQVSPVDEPAGLWPRVPPIRERQSIPTAWLQIVLTEGKNRQVRRMTAKVGLPTLRLIRWQIGDWTVDGLAPGDWRPAEVSARRSSPATGGHGGSPRPRSGSGSGLPLPPVRRPPRHR